jgi:hypothetical protein
VRGAPLRLVPTRANGQPAFATSLVDPHAPIARPFSFLVLTFDGEQISGVFARFGLSRTLPHA